MRDHRKTKRRLSETVRQDGDEVEKNEMSTARMGRWQRDLLHPFCVQMLGPFRTSGHCKSVRESVQPKPHKLVAICAIESKWKAEGS